MVQGNQIEEGQMRAAAQVRTPLPSTEYNGCQLWREHVQSLV